MRKYILFTSYAVILLSISSASILVLLSKAPGSVCAFWRLMFTSILLSLVLFIRRNINFHEYTLLSGLFLGLHFVFWMESLYIIPVFISTLLVVTYPFYNLLFDKLLFRENVSRLQVIGLITGFAGITLYYSPSFSRDLNLLGVSYALFAGFLASLYFTIGRYLRSRLELDLFDYVYPTYLAATTTTLIYNLSLGIELLNYSLESYTYFVLLAIIPMLGGHTLMNYLLRKVKTSTITSIALGEPVGAGLLAYALFKQILDIYKLAVSAIVLISLILVVMGEESTGKP